MKKFLILKGENNRLYGYPDKKINFFSRGRLFEDFLKACSFDYTYGTMKSIKDELPLLVVNIISIDKFELYLDFYLKQINYANLSIKPYIIIDLLKDPIDINTDKIIKLLNKYNIPIDKVIILSSVIKNYKDKRLRIITLPYFLFVSLYCEDIENTKVDIVKRLDNRFLCLNRKLKDFRLFTIAYLDKYSLLNKGIYSLGNFRYESSITDKLRVSPKYNELLNNSNNTLSSLISDKDLTNIIDTFILQDLWQYDFYKSLKGYFNKSLFSIVTEYSYTDTGCFITEKTAFRFLCKHPFIVIGTFNFIKHLRFLGFKTFDKVIDHSYDNEENDNKRLLLAMEEAKRLINLSDNKWIELYETIEEELIYNYNLVLNHKDNIFFKKAKNILKEL